MKKFDGWIIFSDVDGTISTWDFVIPQKNLDALKYFTENGGKFAVATGRGKAGVTMLTCFEYINFPSILTNGTTIYDFVADSVVHRQPLPQKARDMLIEIRNKYPELRLMVWGEEERFDVGARTEVPFEPNYTTIEALDGVWTKIVINVAPEQREQMVASLNEMINDEVDITSSGAEYIEIMPKGVSKGQAIENLIEKYALDRTKICAIGDFYNDFEMLSVPGINTFCPENAEEQIKLTAQKTLCAVGEGAISELIYSL